MPSEADCPQSDQDAPENGDKPPHAHSITPKPSFPITFPPPAQINSSQKTVAPHNPNTARIRAGSTTPPSAYSPSVTQSESEGWASPLPSRNPSRAPSFSAPNEKSSLLNGFHASPQSKPSSHFQAQPPPSTSKIRRPQASEAGGQKFNLMDLLSGSPGLVRRASQRSATSKQSGSERGASSMGETTASLSKKYGVCDRIAIGKGATSVVRLVHKWDRTEEKLYAVKVSVIAKSYFPRHTVFRNSARGERTRAKRST